MEFSFPVRVYYEDTDIAGVVYYANYLKYMERGRSEWLRSLNVEQNLLFSEDIAFAVRRAEVDYFKPARFNDALTVLTRVIQVRGASLVFEQRICRESEPDQTLCLGIVKVVCITMSTMQPRAIPQPVLEEIRRDS